MGTFIGIDVSEKRGCALAALDKDGRAIGSEWAGNEVAEVVAAVRRLAVSDREVTIGIDAPRMPLQSPREWYWDGKRACWRPRRPGGEQGWGRHCEVIVSATGLANPQWTPIHDLAPNWMRLGFLLFTALDSVGDVLEVFPSASYTQLIASDSPRIDLSFRAFDRGPKDMLDAYIGAATVLEFKRGNGAPVGGGDGLGAIVLPRPLAASPSSLLTWPIEPGSRC